MGSSSYFNVHSSGAGDSAGASGHDFGSVGGVDRADGTPLELCAVDADLPGLADGHIWDLVLPSYAFWKFDDFSCGDTRKVERGLKETGHADGEGEFDSTKILIKRWARGGGTVS